MQSNNKRETKDLTDVELCNLIKKEKSDEAILQLQSRHNALIVSISTRLSKKYNNWNITQEIIDDAAYIVYNAAIKYKPNKNTKFSTFLGNETKWAYLNKCNKYKNSNKNLSKLELVMHFITEDNLNNFNSSIVAKDNETINSIYSIINTHPDSRMPKIFKLRYEVGKNNNVMPWHLIGNELGLSAQGCINIHNSGIRFLQEKLENEGIQC